MEEMSERNMEGSGMIAVQSEPVAMGDSPFSLTDGERILLIGDSITEGRRLSRLIESYLWLCQPRAPADIRNVAKGGETAAKFLSRIDQDALRHSPTVALVAYGMNDSGYSGNNENGIREYMSASDQVIQRLMESGCRVILAAPGCIGRLPPWPFIAERKDTLAGLNGTLLHIRDAASTIAARWRVPFVDHFWNLFRARTLAREMYGRNYELCGMDDGVHPSWAGHVVMAHGILDALGCDGHISSITVDLAEGCASVDGGPMINRADQDGIFRFTSLIHPFCAEGRHDADWSVRSGMTLVPFAERFNRMQLRVIGHRQCRYRVDWMNQRKEMEEHHIFAAGQLASGINLAEEYQLNPFTPSFRRIDDLVLKKQLIESRMTWTHDAAEIAGLEIQRNECMERLRRERVPVEHCLRFTPLV